MMINESGYMTVDENCYSRNSNCLVVGVLIILFDTLYMTVDDKIVTVRTPIQVV